MTILLRKSCATAEPELLPSVSKSSIFSHLVNFIFSTDYQWLTRVVRVLSALGDFAFRELTVYFNRINTLKVPEYLQCHLNVSDCFIYLFQLELNESFT